jgi:hypothetical protein
MMRWGFLSSVLNLNWTSGPEFTYSNELSQKLATVVETEPPSDDPTSSEAAAGPRVAIEF